LWVLIALASLIVLIVAFLCIPINTVVCLEVYGRPAVKVKLVWFFGLLSKEIREKKKRIEKKKKRERGIGYKTILEILKIEGLFKHLIRFLLRLIRQFRFKDFQADFSIGFSNQAITGLLYAVGGLLPLPGSVKIRPSFGGSVVKGYAQGTIHLQPIRVLTVILGFIFSLPVMKLIWLLIKDTWKKKN